MKNHNSNNADIKSGGSDDELLFLRRQPSRAERRFGSFTGTSSESKAGYVPSALTPRRAAVRVQSIHIPASPSPRAKAGAPGGGGEQGRGEESRRRGNPSGAAGRGGAGRAGPGRRVEPRGRCVTGGQCVGAGQRSQRPRRRTQMSRAYAKNNHPPAQVIKKCHI
ncbi:Protein of unknown function [Gryllus bimaculatus]|nr:Protein of unknown function [Gryllus bimaculatus]